MVGAARRSGLRNRSVETTLAESIKISKQKDGEDGKQWGMTLIPVNIEEINGKTLSSCVVEYTNSIKQLKTKKKGNVETRVMEAYESMGGGRIPQADLITAVAEKTIHDPASGRDRRRQKASQSIDILLKKGELTLSGGFISVNLT